MQKPSEVGLAAAHATHFPSSASFAQLSSQLIIADLINSKM